MVLNEKCSHFEVFRKFNSFHIPLEFFEYKIGWKELQETKFEIEKQRK